MSEPSSNSITFSITLRRGDFNLESSLSIPATGITALFGHSGSGKTSLLRCIAGLERADVANIRIAAEVWQDDSAGVFMPVHLRRLGYVFQEANLFPHLSVRDNLNYGAQRSQRRQNTSLDTACELLGITSLLARDTASLSGGERQRVAIARALLASPQVLLMDEPLASLDLPRRREILPYLARINRDLKLPILYVTHSPEEVVYLADHLVLMNAGKVTAAGPLPEVLARLDLPEFVHEDFGVVIEGTVESFDEKYQLLEMSFRGGTLQIPSQHRPAGSQLRIQIKARDISLNLTRPTSTSILNLIDCTVDEEARPDGEAHVLVRLNAQGTALLARITKLSHDRLEICPGKRVWAQIKAVAIS